MTQRALATAALTAACFAALTALPAQAQGLRLPGIGAATGAGPRLALPLSTPSSGQRQADYIVAVVNSEPVTNNEVRLRAGRLAQQLQQQGVPMPSASELLAAATERIITERTQLQFAKETGIKVDDLQVDQAEQAVAAQNQVNVAELRRRVVAEGVSPQLMREELRNQIVLQRLRERDVEPRVRISDIEVEQYMREQQQQNDLSKQQVEIAQILIPVPETATPAQVAELQAKAQGLYDRAAKGEDFAQLARQQSGAPEASRGGSLGLRPADRFPDLFIDAVRPLAVGSVARPLRSGAGFHILKLVDKRQDGMGGPVTQTHARHILLRTGPKLTQAEAVAQLADYKRRIQASQADFAALARENSQDGSANGGGDLGWTRPGQFVPEFDDAMARLQPGEVSDPVISRFGVHLIQVLERREVANTAREQRDAARAAMREKKLDEAFNNWQQDIRARAYVEMREPAQ